MLRSLTASVCLVISGYAGYCLLELAADPENSLSYKLLMILFLVVLEIILGAVLYYLWFYPEDR